MMVSVHHILSVLDEAFPRVWAEAWDLNGLSVGDPDAPVAGVYVTLDPTPAAVERAVSHGANVVVTHHPPFLKPLDRLMPGTDGAGTAFAAASAGVALVNAHTNLDRAPAAARLLPERLGLRYMGPIEQTGLPMSMVTAWTPVSAESQVRDAMTRAGAGRIGAYDSCSFTASGTGRYRALESDGPGVAGAGGTLETADEVRIEALCAPGVATAVAQAARAASPYEEPLVTIQDVDHVPSGPRFGALSVAPDPLLTVEELAALCASTFDTTPRVWGVAGRKVEHVATSTGSASSFLGMVAATSADVLVCGELRYHDALAASEAGLALIELGHDVSEWPLVGLLGDTLRSASVLAGVDITVEPASRVWWTP